MSSNLLKPCPFCGGKARPSELEPWDETGYTNCLNIECPSRLANKYKEPWRVPIPLWQMFPRADSRSAVSEPAKDLAKVGRDPNLASFLATADSNEMRERMLLALDFVVRYGGIDGGHHKQWVLDQVAHVLTGDNYGEMIKYICDGDDGPETYDWSTGVAP